MRANRWSGLIVVHDAGNVLSGRYRVTELPVTFVIDPAGRIRFVGTAAESEEDLGGAIAAAR